MFPRNAIQISSFAKALTFAAALATLAACSPADPADPRAAAGTWPPKDYTDFAARSPMSVGRELEDEWTMAIEAERWSYIIGVAIVAAGGRPPADEEVVATAFLDRTAAGLHDAAQRLIALRNLTCSAPSIAKPEDCAAFTAPPWATSIARAKKEELQARLQWLEANAFRFVHPACEIAIKRTGDQYYCSAE
jgi:hypothetical protein